LTDHSITLSLATIYVGINWRDRDFESAEVQKNTVFEYRAALFLKKQKAVFSACDLSPSCDFYMKMLETGQTHTLFVG
jgi:hypothetical protein